MMTARDVTPMMATSGEHEAGAVIDVAAIAKGAAIAQPGFGDHRSDVTAEHHRHGRHAVAAARAVCPR